MAEPDTSLASYATVPQEKQLQKTCNLCKISRWQDPIQVWPNVLLSLKKSNSEKKWNLCKNPGCQNPIQVWPRVLLSLMKSKSGKNVICVKNPG
jgi:hypothetical protein